MLLLFETAAGYALFKATDDGRLAAEGMAATNANEAAGAELFELKSFRRFKNTSEALEACTALVESKLGKSLKSFVKRNIIKKDLTEEVLCVADARIGAALKENVIGVFLPVQRQQHRRQDQQRDDIVSHGAAPFPAARPRRRPDRRSRRW